MANFRDQRCTPKLQRWQSIKNDFNMPNWQVGQMIGGLPGVRAGKRNLYTSP